MVKTNYIKGILATILLLCSATSWAYDFNMNGIFYNILSEEDLTCEVTYGNFKYNDFNTYSGSVVIPETVLPAVGAIRYYTVVGIGDQAFRDCTDLTSVTIGNNVTSIGKRAFYRSSKLTSMTIPESVTEIGDGAFSGCTSLTSITIPGSVTTIGESAFYNCTSLTEVTIPESVTEIGSGAFNYCTGLTEVNFNATACTSDDSVCRGSGKQATVNMGNNVTQILDYLFEYFTGLTQVTIGESVASIGKYAFYGCEELTKVNFNAIACTSAGDSYPLSSWRAFYGCTNISTVTIGEDVTQIPAYLFYDCTGITQVNFNAIACTSDSYLVPTDWNSQAICMPFGNCTPSEVNIGDKVTILPDYLFLSCSEITEVNFNATACTSAGFCTFDGSTNIFTVNFGNNVTIIPDYLFYACSNLSGTLTIPNSVTSIGSKAFASCAGLTSVTIGNSVTEIGSSAFASCTGLTEVTIPNSVTEIGSFIFQNCTGLTSVIIGNSVTSIGSQAFASCTGLASVTIGNSVTEIGDGAFSGCTRLTSVYSLNPEPPTCSSSYNIGVFYDVDKSSCTLYVPISSKKSYSNANTWKDFYNILEIDENGNLFDPTVQTNAATDISTNSATLNGSVTAGTEAITTQGFEYWKTSRDVLTVTAQGEEMSVTITKLESSTAYTYRAYATTESGTTYGEEMTFTTMKAPTVKTSSATYISEDSATLNGSVTEGDEEILEQGFEYWAKGGEIQTIIMSDQLMTITLTELVSGTTYTYRAYATTDSGTTYGEEVSFTTLGLTPPTVLTYEATDITGNSATLKGAIRVGDEEILEHGFVYWTGDGDVQTITSTKDYMSETIAGLKPSTTYTYRAYATTESGTTYGEELSFTTLDYADGVSDVNEDLEEEARYTTDGKKVSQPVRGINIVRYSDGTARKVLVK